MKERYPCLEVNINKIYNNTKIVKQLCEKQGIRIAGVIKGFNAMPEAAIKMVEGGCQWLASSRIEQLKDMKEVGIKAPTLLLRIPMLSELEDVIKYADVSLNSEKETLERLNGEAEKQNKKHKVVLMYDLGDLREGVLDRDELINLALYVENDLENIELYGIGTNLSCYGSIVPTTKNLTELSNAAEEIEEKLGRKLELISGGATTVLPLLIKNGVPNKINHLRLGEGIINTQDLPLFWDVEIEGLDKDTFVLKAQIVEIGKKPTHPIGEIGVAAFGETGVYEDRGIRKRAILAVGNQDLGNCSKLVPKDKNIEILGGSSDHTIIDIEDSLIDYKLGDIVEFNVLYQAMLFTTQSKSVYKKIIE